MAKITISSPHSAVVYPYSGSGVEWWTWGFGGTVCDTAVWRNTLKMCYVDERDSVRAVQAVGG